VRDRWSPAGVAVIILTIAVATVIVVGVIDLANDNPASSEAARWLAGVTGAALGCIATYIGVHSPSSARALDRRTDETQQAVQEQAAERDDTELSGHQADQEREPPSDGDE
jgi:hypothetical protein